MAYTTIDDPAQYFNTVLWTGDGNDDRNITGVGFQPDMVWEKKRNEAGSHRIADSIRGATNVMFPDLTNAEASRPNEFQAFISDGFQIGDDSNFNGSSNTHAGWSWLAGGSSSSNSDGDITSSVSANTTSGFSIVTFTGNGTASGTIGHGLGVAPKIVLYKKRNGTSDWFYWTTQIDGSNDDLRLNTTGTKSDLSGSSGSITASTFSNYGWGSSDNMVCYCFAEKKGYSKFGSYTGNGNANGNFNYLGFKPSFILLKGNNTENWSMYDNKRLGYNVDNNVLYPNANSAEGTSDDIDFLSNGFKIRRQTGLLNDNNVVYIYMAFAESPFVNSNSVPTNAR